MKATKIIIASLLVISAIAYAAKPLDFAFPGLQGYTKPAGIQPEVSYITNSFDEVTGVADVTTVYDFGNKLGPKGQVQFTEANNAKACVKVSSGKAVAQKGGKVVGELGTVETGFNGVALKLKGIAVGTVVSVGLKSAQVKKVSSELRAGDFDKGTAFKAVETIEGTIGGKFKSIQANQFVGDIDGTAIRTFKKVVFKAKQAGGTITVSPNLVYKNKNVNVVPVVTE